MNKALQQLRAAATVLGVALPEQALDRLRRYATEVLAWRARLNLTGAASLANLVDPHFLDVLLLLHVVEVPHAAAVVDVGTGAGLPGVPLQIIRPDIRLVLIEASRKKVAFLEHLETALALPGLRIEWGRAETLAHRSDLREAFDVALTQATAPLVIASELCMPFVKVHGAGLYLKGPSALQEVEHATEMATALGARVESCARHPLPTTPLIRTIVVLRKWRTTPSRYPRSPRVLGRPPKIHRGTQREVAE